MYESRQPEDGRVQVPRSLQWLAPIEVEGLVRVGGAYDGGYVVPDRLLREADVLISMGLGYSWSFEREARILSPDIRIHVYDHTVSEKAFRSEYLATFAAAMTGRADYSAVRRRWNRLREYRHFFRREATHYRERIHDWPDHPAAVDIRTVFERAGAGRVFVKMDIEGTEYRVLEDVLEFGDRILGLAVEFHDTGPLRPVFLRTMEQLRHSFDIVHLHANNFTPPYKDGLPEALEITFARKGLLGGERRRRELPIPGLDWPNTPGQPDYRLVFESTTEELAP